MKRKRIRGRINKRRERARKRLRGPGLVGGAGAGFGVGEWAGRCWDRYRGWWLVDSWAGLVGLDWIGGLVGWLVDATAMVCVVQFPSSHW
jgi:hypothetical protein